MNIVYSLVILSCALWETNGFPSYYPYYGTNVDSLSFGATDNTRGAMVLSRYYDPYYNPRAVGGGLAAFMFRQPETPQPAQQTQQAQTSQYYLPDRRRQTSPESNFIPQQQNDVFYPQAPQVPENPIRATEPTDIAEPTEKTEVFPTTARATIEPELTEPEIEEVAEPVQRPRKRVTKKKQVKKPVDDDDEDDDGYTQRELSGAYFPIFFGWGGKSGGGAPGGATAIANAYSTGRGGVASSHATAYGAPKPNSKP